MITPAVVVDYQAMVRNLKSIQDKCDEKGIKLRPHFKAHKTPSLSKIQEDIGAIGFTTAKLSEAELLVKEGFKDIVVAYPIVNEVNAHRLKEIAVKADIKVIVDSHESVDVLSRVFGDHTLKILIKIDTGLNRCGLKPENDNILNFAKYILKKGNLNLLGLLTHAGHSYKSQNLDELKRISYDEGKMLINLKKYLEDNDVEINEISVGSTPTLNFVLDVLGVTEVRPGNYIFNDCTQISLNTATEENCALVVKSTVVSKGSGKVIIDAGSKTLGLDKGTHGNDILKGFGKIKEYPDLEIFALSEEHGFVKGEELPKIGETISIIPNHSCVVMNLAPRVYLKKDNIIEKIDNIGRNLNY